MSHVGMQNILQILTERREGDCYIHWFIDGLQPEKFKDKIGSLSRLTLYRIKLCELCQQYFDEYERCCYAFA